MNFYETHSYRNISATLVLQKLFGVYYYSSAYALKYFELKPKSCGHYDIFNMNMLSKGTTVFFSTNTYETRVDKLRMISTFNPDTNHLTVCTDIGHHFSGAQIRIVTTVAHVTAHT